MNTNRRPLLLVFCQICCLALSAMTVFVPIEAHACGAGSSGATCGGAGVASLGNSSGTNQGGGNPINVITGNKFEQEVDLPALPGVLGLEIVRYYNSALASPQATGRTIGRGWRLSYETQLYPVRNTLQIMQADGTRIIFVRNAKDPSQCATKDPANGSVRELPSSEGGGYVWTWADGRKLRFNWQGKLVRITAATGEILRLQHNMAGELVKVTDPEGRSLTLHYPKASSGSPNGAVNPPFDGVHAIDSPVGRFVYTYGSPVPQGFTGDRGLLAANLSAVTLPNGVSRHYLYEDPRHPSFLTGLSVTAKAVDGVAPTSRRIRTWAYDKQGRGILSVLGKPRQLNDKGDVLPGTGIGQVDFAYPSPSKTVLTNSLGQKTVFTHTVIGQENRLLEVRGAGCTGCGTPNRRYGYDKQGRMIADTRLAPDGHPLSTTQTRRDALGRPIEIRQIEYLHGKPQPARLFVRYTYAGEAIEPNQIIRPSVVPGKEFVTHIAYNTVGQPTRVTESGFSPIDAQGHTQPTALSRTTTYTYRTINGRSLLTRIDGPLPDGPKQSPADSDITEIKWDKQGNFPTKIINPTGLTQQINTRDDAGRPTLVTNIDGQPTRLAYAYTGQATQIEHEQRKVQITYDARMQPVALQNNAGQTIRINYQPEQGKLSYTLPDGQTLAEHYNTEMRVTATDWLGHQGQTLGNPTRYHYDTQTGLLSGITQPSGLQISFNYNALGELNHWQQGKIKGQQHFDPMARLLSADVSGTKYSAGVDKRNGALALTLPTGAVHTQLTDDFGRVVQQTSPERGTRTARYDLTDHTIEVRDALRVMTARYDMAGRIVEREHKDLIDGRTQGVRYVWHGALLVEIDDDAQQTEYTYDQYSHRTSERITYKATPNAGATSYTTLYHYDQLGRLNRVKLPEGATLIYRFDAISRVVQTDYQPPALTEWAKASHQIWKNEGTRPLISNLKTDSAHGLLSFTHSNGERATARYDSALRLVGWQDGSAHTQLKYNPDGDISQLVRNRQILGLDYNPQGRLAKVVEGNQTEHFDLDTNGNRLSQTQPSGQTETYKYRHASDQLLAAGSQSYRYNSVGEPVQIETGTDTRHLNYGPMGELDSVSTQQAGKKPSIAIYHYNQDLQRIAKTVNGQTTFFLWQGGRISAEADAHGHIRTRYLYLGNRPVEVIKYNTRGQPHIYAVLTDHLGAPLAVADEHKNIVWQAQYNIYGRATVRDHSLHSGASPPTNAISRIFGITDAQDNIPSANFQFNLRLPGQYEDTETGYYYNFHRYYDPKTGRYLTPDPIGLEGGTNLYGYVDGNPVMASDPLGLDWEAADGNVPGWANRLIVGYRVHQMFSKYIKKRNLGFFTDSTYDGTFGSLRPDVYDPIEKKIWELKPLGNRDNPAAYKIITNQVDRYVSIANRAVKVNDPQARECGGWSKGATNALFNQGQRLGYVQIGEGPFRRVYEITLWRDKASHGVDTGLVFYRADLIENPAGKFFDSVLKTLANAPVKWVITPLPFRIPVLP
ncbi:hypothetical protein A9404_06175 [Halothiobacillus diazotrophicus]|uniref:Uncharacterized protein n=2 Tax=Halothiobacillus diazotrophicus TaxID=1860122 RepID=A0A191ZGK8_9GAMM|nr:hypothetical protein A9404_06175 [Halothiobacillus diazotrophicus]